jgi:hypothetical protein
LRPPKAILVPGMNFLGFSRYSNWRHRQQLRLPLGGPRRETYESLLVPLNTLLLVGVGVGVALDLAGLASEQTVKSGTGLGGSAGLDGVALLATSLEELGALRGVTCGGLLAGCD